MPDRLQEIRKNDIVYVLMRRNYAELHTTWNAIYKRRITMSELKKILGDAYLPISRSCLVRLDQIHHMDSRIVLLDGKKLDYALSAKQRIVEEICKRKHCSPGDFLVSGYKKTKTSIANKKTLPDTKESLSEVTENKVSESKEKSENNFSKEVTPSPVTVKKFQDGQYLTVLADRKQTLVPIRDILYIYVRKTNIEIYTSDEFVIKSRGTLSAIEEMLGDRFIKIDRNCLVAVKAVYSITDKVNLINGETLLYAKNRKKSIVTKLAEGKKQIFNDLKDEHIPATPGQFRKYFRCYDDAPFAFADIEMIFDEESMAVDWIFRYGNKALEKLEKIPLNKLLGASFGSLFKNMDSKWLRFYEQTVLYGKTMEIMDYSPEIDTNLKVICYPTFHGHCGCILFDLDHLETNIGVFKKFDQSVEFK